jgi:hypothetical protein
VIICDYTCDVCTVIFEATVESPAPDDVSCPTCGQSAHWTPSPVACHMPRVTAVRGKWEKPARPTYLDTRELGEGMDMEDFQAKRAAVWERKRQEDVMAVKKGFG